MQSLGQTFAASAPVALFSQSVQILIKQFNSVPQEEQLAVLQDILGRVDTRFTQACHTLDENMKLAFWHRLFHRRRLDGLAYGQLTPNSQVLLTRLSRMGLNERLNFLWQALA
ncbi:MAG: orange carotenoid protein N-terminal domain-containing protein [Nodosilinea sp.]